MKLVIQRVKKAKVSVAGETVGEINKGIFVLVGVGHGDSEKEANILAEKLIKLRIMSDQNDKMNLSVQEAGGEILVVSQFTLYANTEGGNRPSFIEAAEPEAARKIYEFFVKFLKRTKISVQTGKFGEYMKIDAVLDGPVTILINSKDVVL